MDRIFSGIRNFADEGKNISDSTYGEGQGRSNVNMELKLRAKNHVDMTSGPLAGKILMFALPLIASGMLQQSFNVVDVAVIGHYSTSAAIAAVGSNGAIISIIVNLFIGIAVGANAVIARYIGEGKVEDIRRSVGTVILISLISGLFLLGIGVTLTRPILEAMGTPPEVIDLASVYLRIFFVGMPFMMVYNFGGAILRSVGDTNKIFESLFIASVCNVGFDILFTGTFGMGVEGVAWATVISNAINAAILLYFLNREPDPYKVRMKPSTWKLSVKDLNEMLRIGVPAGVQGMVFSISNIFIIASINKFGADALAANALTLTFESYCYFIIAGFNGATIAFTSQNYGAMKPHRCKRVWKICMIYSVCIVAVCNILLVLFENETIGIFSTDPEVMHYASIRYNVVILFQSIAASYEISGSYMRGLGYSVIPMLLTIFGTCVLRLFWVWIFPHIDYSLSTLLSIYPISWTVTGIMVVVAAFIVQHKVFNRQSADALIPRG